MRRWIVASGCAVFALALASCIDTPVPGFDIEPGAEKESGQVADVAAKDGDRDDRAFSSRSADPGEEVLDAPEVPEDLARLEWLVPEADEAGAALEALRLRVENLSAFDISVDVFAEFLGLLAREARLELGVHQIQAEDDIVLEIPAGTIPVQSTGNFCQAVANAVAAASTTSDDETVAVSQVPAVAVFYRHGTGYEGVSVFTEQDVDQQFEGRLVAVDQEILTEGMPAVLDSVLGRVAAGEGFADVRVRDAVETDAADEETPWVIGHGTDGGKLFLEEDAVPPVDEDAEIEISDRGAPYLRICTRWSTSLTGVGGGEDWYVSSGTQWREAQYSLGAIYQYDNGQWVRVPGTTDVYMTTLVDGRYCTPYFDVEWNRTYRFWQRTTLKSGNRQIMILHDDATWQNRSPRSLYTDIVMPSQGNYHTAVADPTTLTKHTSMTAVARMTLNRASDLGFMNEWAEGIYVNMEINANECPDGACCYHPRKLCNSGQDQGITGPPAHAVCFGTNNSSISKFVSGHELGHAIAHQGNAQTPKYMQGPMPTGYDADVSPVFGPGAWACQANDAGYSHALNTREFTGTAQGEGFAHFVATTLFNVRETDGYFKYYKVARIDNSSTCNSCWVDVTANKRHTHNYCAPSGWTGVGTEWDWMNFFWNIWTIGDHKWNVSDIYSVWKNTEDSPTEWCCGSPTNCRDTEPPWWLICNETGGWQVGRYGKKWNDLQATVTDNWDDWGWSQNKRDRFSAQGTTSRVKY